MIEDNSWIKSYRKIKDWKFRRDPKIFSVWMHLLHGATHFEKTINFNGCNVVLKPGQLITGRYSIEESTGVHHSSVVRILNKLKSEHQIEQLKTSRYSIISIVNWEQYQSGEHLNEHPVNIQRTSSEHPVNTIKNDNNDKNDKNVKNKSNPQLDDCLLALPGQLKTPIGMEAMTDWFNSRKEKRKPITPTTLKLLLKKISTWTPEQFESAVEYSQGYQGLFLPKQPLAFNKVSKSEAKEAAFKQHLESLTPAERAEHAQMWNGGAR